MLWVGFWTLLYYSSLLDPGDLVICQEAFPPTHSAHPHQNYTCVDGTGVETEYVLLHCKGTCLVGGRSDSSQLKV